MPKAFLTSESRREAEINRTLAAMAKGKQSQLAEVWGISQPAVHKRIKSGNITLLDLYKAKDILQFNLRTINYLIGGDIQ